MSDQEFLKNLSPKVQMQYLRPSQFENAARAVPIVYIPLGLIEWHGQHLPLGTDALKAHAILVKCAEKHGGLVYPPLYFPSSTYAEGMFQEEDLEHKVPILSDLFLSLKRTGFRVIMAVSGHNTNEQIELVERALELVKTDGTLAGMGLWEVTLVNSNQVGTDHAAKWETSDMLFFYPELVSLSALGDEEISNDKSPRDGIYGLDPRQHASAEVGGRKARLTADAIGKKAHELLFSLPPEHRAFNQPFFDADNWWQI